MTATRQEERVMEHELRRQISEEICSLLSRLVKDAYERCEERPLRRDYSFYQAQAQAYETARLLLRDMIEQKLH